MALHHRKLPLFLESLSDRKFSMVMAIALFTGILAVFLPPSLFGIQQVAQRSEVLDTHKEVNRVIGIINNELTRLERISRDYSAWDDTYQFAQDGNQEYIELNMTVEVMSNLGINLFMVLGKDGQVKAVRSLDLAQGQLGQPPFNIDDLFQKYPELLQNNEVTSNHKGMVVVEDQAMLVSSLPVLTSLYEGPLAGSLIFGVFLDQTEKEALSSLAQREINIWLPGQSGLSNMVKAQMNEISGANIVTYPLDEQIIAGYQAFDDINAQPGVIVQVNNHRDLYQQGKNVSIFFSVLFVALGLLTTTLVYRLTLSYMRSRRSGRQTLERFRAIFDQSSDAILLVDGYGKILDANPSSLKMFKLEKDDVQKVSFFDLLINGENPVQNMFICIDENGTKVSEYRCLFEDGTHIDVEMSASKVQSLDLKAYSTIIRDITANKEAQEAVRISDERYQLAMRGSNDGLWDWDILTDNVYFSPRWKSTLGYGEEEISSSPNEWFDRVHPDDRIPLKGILDDHLNRHSEHFEYEHRMLHKNGDYRWMLSRGVAVWNSAGFALRIAGSQTDITKRKLTEEQLRYNTLHDAMTGLGNRTLLIDRLNHVNQRKKRNPDTLFAVLFLDLDRFKQVNDGFGHQVGDQILVETSRRLESQLRQVDTVARTIGSETLARIAGDEFVILLEDIRETEDAERIAGRISKIMAEPFNIKGKEIIIGASIGIAVPEEPYEQPEDIIRDADIAMYKAKKTGGETIVRFTQEMYDSAFARMQLESELHRAVERQEFVLHYQPIYTLRDDSVIGFEALVRWNHPQRGLLLPKDFIALAEDTGLIVPIGYGVLREACSRMRQWQGLYGLATQMIMSVNLSARQLASPDLLTRVKMILKESALEPTNLWLEITETTLIENLEKVQQILIELRKLGIRIEIDDFGVGYSSLSYLQNLPVDGFKIDRSFIEEFSGEDQRVVNALVELGKKLNLIQVAEGVETLAQKEHLRNLSCEYLQGYLMARPMSVELIETFFSELIARKQEANKEVDQRG